MVVTYSHLMTESDVGKWTCYGENSLGDSDTEAFYLTLYGTVLCYPRSLTFNFVSFFDLLQYPINCHQK